MVLGVFVVQKKNWCKRTHKRSLSLDKKKNAAGTLQVCPKRALHERARSTSILMRQNGAAVHLFGCAHKETTSALTGESRTQSRVFAEAAHTVEHGQPLPGRTTRHRCVFSYENRNALLLICFGRSLGIRLPDLLALDFSV